MSTVDLQLPESLHRRVRMLALRTGVSINQIITSVVEEKVSAPDAQSGPERRARRRRLTKAQVALPKVSKINPNSHERLSAVQQAEVDLAALMHAGVTSGKSIRIDPKYWERKKAALRKCP